MKKYFVLIGLILATTAFAAPMADAPQDCDGVKIATGPKGKGYSLLFADIKKVCGSKVAVCEVTTSGGLDNINALSTKEADLGFVQIDTLNDMKGGDENVAALQRVIPLNYNYLHVITSSSGFTVTGAKKMGGFMKGDQTQVVINKFSELRGQRVALVGSAKLLGRRLNATLGYQMQVIDVADDNAAFAMVKRGEVAAAFTVSGWPSGTVKALTQESGLTMIPFDAPVNDPFKVRPLNYKGMAVYNSNTLAVPNLLVTRPFSGARAANVATIQQCITQSLSDLKEGNFQPAWNEIKDINESYNVAPFKLKK